MIRLGIAIQETWSFFNEIYANLIRHYKTTLFRHEPWQLPIYQTQINRYLLQNRMRKFMRSNDVVFFEWASELLTIATHLPKDCGIVTRLHRYELYEWVDRINWDLVDRVVLVSHAKQREFVAKFPNQSSKVVVLPPSIPLGKFSPGPKPFTGDIGVRSSDPFGSRSAWRFSSCCSA